MQKDLVAAAIRAVVPTTQGWAVFLGNEEKTFVIYVDQFVGRAIQMTLNGEKKERPLTHDLIGSILLGLGARVDHVIINDMVINDTHEGTYYARVFLRMDNELGKKIVEIDARPSDSIVLALQQKRPIYVVRAVFERAEDRTETLEQLLKQQAEEGEEEQG
ncbi:MAG TPA: bifunctional nuclease family protein [Opitutaceae bacterium]|nr:bifunctional nuclease family protein [Opitutaceae bacterium]